MKNADVVSLSELHGTALLEWAREQGFGVVKSKGDTAILYNATKFEASRGGSHTLNQTEGPTGGMRSREAAYVLLRDKNTGEQFWQIAAHTTPPKQGPKRLRQKIRKEQYAELSQLAKRLRESGDGLGKVPVLLAGDLNFRDPNIKGLHNATKGGVMHTLAKGVRFTDVDRLNTRGDHALVTTTYTTGKGRKQVGGRESVGPVPKDKVLLNNEGDPLDPAELRREYGFGYAFFKSDPELWKLLKTAIAEGYDQAMLVAQLQETKWFKTHSDAWRKNMGLKFTDPATYQERLQNVRNSIENLAGQFGVQLTNKEINRYAERAFLQRSLRG
jgi:hypothetical protein